MRLFYNANGKCMGMLTLERLRTLLEAYEAAKRAGIHDTIQPPVQDSATEIMGLLSRQKAHQKKSFCSKQKDFKFKHAYYFFLHSIGPAKMVHGLSGEVFQPS